MPRKRSPSCSPACRNSTAGILSSWCRMPARATARWRSLSGRLASPPSNCSPNGTAASMTPGTGPWLGRAVSGCSSWAATTASRTRTFWAKQRRCCGRWPPASALPQEAYACWTQGDNADFSPHRFWTPRRARMLCKAGLVSSAFRLLGPDRGATLLDTLRRWRGLPPCWKR